MGLIIDKLFLQESQKLLKSQRCTGTITAQNPDEITLNALLKHGQQRIETAKRHVCMDMTTQAVLPHLYDIKRFPSTSQGVFLKWLPTDASIACLLFNDSLRDLVECPAMQQVWKLISASSPETARTLNSIIQHQFGSCGRNINRSASLPTKN